MAQPPRRCRKIRERFHAKHECRYSTCSIFWGLQISHGYPEHWGFFSKNHGDVNNTTIFFDDKSGHWADTLGISLTFFLAIWPWLWPGKKTWGKWPVSLVVSPFFNVACGKLTVNLPETHYAYESFRCFCKIHHLTMKSPCFSSTGCTGSPWWNAVNLWVAGSRLDSGDRM